MQKNVLFRLPAGVRHVLEADCELVELQLMDVLAEKGKEPEYAHFPVSGLISLITVADKRAGVELGMVGNENMLGSHLSLGMSTSPLLGIVQGSGLAYRMSAPVFQKNIEEYPSLRELVNACFFALNLQQATSAACLRFHQVEQRLARWLLMSADRMAATYLPVTREFLQYMLGIRHLGTSIASSTMLRDNFIHYREGAVTIVDREGLAKCACSCYAESIRDYNACFQRFPILE